MNDEDNQQDSDRSTNRNRYNSEVRLIKLQRRYDLNNINGGFIDKSRLMTSDSLICSLTKACRNASEEKSRFVLFSNILSEFATNGHLMVINGELNRCCLYWKMSITPDCQYDPNISMHTFKNNRSQEHRKTEKVQKYSRQKVLKYVIYK